MLLYILIICTFISLYSNLYRKYVKIKECIKTIDNIRTVNGQQPISNIEYKKIVKFQIEKIRNCIK